MIDYRQIDAINQSTLKKILISPKEYLKARDQMESSTGAHFVFGTIVDLMLTSDRAEFDEKFVVLPDSISVTDTVKTIVEGVYRDLKEQNVEITESDTLNNDKYRDLILRNCQYQNYQPNWKEDTRVNKIIELGSSYFQFLSEAKDRQVVSNEEYSKAVLCVTAMRQDPYTKEYCSSKKSSSLEIKDKLVVEFEYRDLQFKGELDRVIIDHEKKIITPIDFKTTSKSVLGFQYEFWKYRYDFQAAMYTLGLKSQDWLYRLVKEQGYVLDDFLYIVVEKELYNNPMCFRVTAEVYDIGLRGGIVYNSKYEGLDDAINRYKYAVEHDRWDYPMEYYNNGHIILKNQ
jgi:hypothetical protein